MPILLVTPNIQGEKIPGRNAWNKFNIQAKDWSFHPRGISMQMKRNLILAVVTAAAFSLGLLAAQTASQKNMNDWSYSKVKVSDSIETRSSVYLPWARLGTAAFNGSVNPERDFCDKLPRNLN
jgi:hypothetical protein